MTLPWLPFFIASIVKWIMDVFRRRETETAHGDADQETLNRLRLYALAWMLVPLLFFSFSGSKLPGYIVPAVPPAVVISGIFLARLITRNDIWRFPTQIIALFMLLIVYISIGFALPSFADEDSVRSLIAAADRRGYSQSKVMGYQFAPHSAEFYVPGRLFREPDGKQKFISDIGSVNSVSLPGQPVLLLVPQSKLAEVQATESIKTEVLGSNGKLYIVAVEPK